MVDGENWEVDSMTQGEACRKERSEADRSEDVARMMLVSYKLRHQIHFTSCNDRQWNAGTYKIQSLVFISLLV